MCVQLAKSINFSKAYFSAIYVTAVETRCLIGGPANFDARFDVT